MKAHDGQPSSRLQDAFSRCKRTIELAKLVIHVKPERLKCARRGMFRIIVAPSQNAGDKIGKLLGALERRGFAVLHDRRSDSARAALLP